MNDAIASGIPEPHDAQKKILTLPGRYKIAVCGRRFGKTVAAAIAAVRRCASFPGQQVWWISPVQDQSDRVEREVAYWLRERMRRPGRKKAVVADDDEAEVAPLAWQHKMSEHALSYDNGSRIEFHSAHNADHLRGAGLDLVVVDEAADVSEYTWKTVLKPMLLERRGEAFIVGTPRGKNHWLHRIFMLGQSGSEGSERGTYASIQLPTQANPLVPVEDLEDYKLEMTPEMYRQEFEAEFIDGVDTIFAGVENCLSGEVLRAGRPGASYVTGIDLGQSKDFTVLCSISCADNRVEGFARFNHMDWSLQEQHMLDHLRRFPGPAIIDSTGAGKPIFESLQKKFRGHLRDFPFTQQSRIDILAGLQLGISNRALSIPRVPELLDELYSFTHIETPNTRPGATGLMRKMGVPGGMHDDCVMALALAWHGSTKLALWGAGDGNPFIDRGVYG